MLYGGHIKTVEHIGLLQEMGFDFGELVFSKDHSIGYWRGSGLQNCFNSDFFMIAHGPREGPPNDLDNLRNRCHPSYRQTIDATSEMRISFLTLHLWVDARFVKPEVLQAKIEVLRELVDYGQTRGVQVSLENLSESATDLARMVEAVPGLVLTLDIGHGQLLAETNTAPGIIERLGPFIGHVHVHDNRGGNGVKDDLHLPIGEGVIDYPGIMETLVKSGYDRTITLELEPEVLQASRETIQAMIRNCRNLKKE